MPDPIHVHVCPRCGRAWHLHDFLQLTVIGVKQIPYREDGQLRHKPMRDRRCGRAPGAASECGQVLHQAI